MTITDTLRRGGVGPRARPRAGADEPVEFRIGVVASVTGPFAAPTKDTFDGFNAWMKQRGLGRKIVLQTLDDETNPVNAANAFRRLASDPQIALIYLFINSNSAMAAKSFASEFKVPIITGGGADVLGVPARSVDVQGRAVEPRLHDRACPSTSKRKGYTKVAHLYSTDTFGQYDHTNLQKLAPQYGYKLVAEESFAIEDTSFNAQLTRIRAANPDLIYSSASARAAILAFKQYKQLGLTTPLVVAGSAISEAFFNAIGGPTAADGLMMMTQRGSLGDGLGGEAAKYHAELKEGLGGRTPVFFNVFGFDVGLITAAAVNAVRRLAPGHPRCTGEAEGPAGNQWPGDLHAAGPHRPGLAFHRAREAGERQAGAGRLMDATIFLQLLLPGLTTGCVYALVALGFVLCANVSGVVNFAQGEFVMLGGMAAAWLIGLDVPFALAVLAATAIGAMVGAAQEFLTLAPVRRQPHFIQITTTVGFAVVLRGITLIVAGKDALSLPGFSGDGVIFCSVPSCRCRAFGSGAQPCFCCSAPSRSCATPASVALCAPARSICRRRG